ncbi:hypothetical protein KIW84_034083 [Lathyrus oleraceus]|uniref:DUF4283 domain-containing protein n=1 Tax=Pisum sativum TaxID=3888 RepID=A0A9D5B3Y6_PEA|nr:hypothetical protein KIW84_034083 [Pisum sativum]
MTGDFKDRANIVHIARPNCSSSSSSPILTTIVAYNLYLGCVEVRKHNLYGTVVWPKGSTPLTIVALKNKVTPLWKGKAKWGIISLGKWFYEFSFTLLEDVKRVRSSPSWNLQPGYLKLLAWSKDFNHNIHENTSTHVWVRMYGLSKEYWRSKILFFIASSKGTPICTDSFASKPMTGRTFGHYVRVLMELGLSQTLTYKVLVERKNFAFFVEMDYESLLTFCSHCNMTGHDLESCFKVTSKKIDTTHHKINIYLGWSQNKNFLK